MILGLWFLCTLYGCKCVFYLQFVILKSRIGPFLSIRLYYVTNRCVVICVIWTHFYINYVKTIQHMLGYRLWGPNEDNWGLNRLSDASNF